MVRHWHSHTEQGARLVQPHQIPPIQSVRRVHDVEELDRVEEGTAGPGENEPDRQDVGDEKDEGPEKPR